MLVSKLPTSFDGGMAALDTVKTVHGLDEAVGDVYQQHVDAQTQPVFYHSENIESYVDILNNYLFCLAHDHATSKDESNRGSSIHYVYRDVLEQILIQHAIRYLPIGLIHRITDDKPKLSIGDLGTIISRARDETIPFIPTLLCLSMLMVFEKGLPYSISADIVAENSIHTVCEKYRRRAASSKKWSEYYNDPLHVKAFISRAVGLPNETWKDCSNRQYIAYHANRAKHILFRSWMVYTSHMNTIFTV